MTSNTYERMVERYKSGEIPWDDTLPPPEVIELVDELTPGRALDLGCGYGRASIYLAQQGWQVDGVDFVPEAIAEAAVRAKNASVADNIHFHLSSVSKLHFLEGPYDLALDVGCLHGLAESERGPYRDGLRRLLAPGGIYLLFIRLAEAGDEAAEEENGPPGVLETAVRALFADGFYLKRVTYGETQVENRSPWTSAWFHYIWRA
ncbi:MAG: class I SAM-dependent methyltransferase [Anaerolineae bacterium]